ncbi:MAG: hypothetical protein IPK85_03145 [Gemmatimonadetes bacterium]|nr:hypothetical protein [Gemmatimonadota bacterium]
MSPNRADWDTDEVDQILTWKHTTRTMYNRNYRALTGRQGLVEPGEDVLFKVRHASRASPTATCSPSARSSSETTSPTR